MADPADFYSLDDLGGGDAQASSFYDLDAHPAAVTAPASHDPFSVYGPPSGGKAALVSHNHAAPLPPSVPHRATPRRSSTATPAPKEPDWKNMSWGEVASRAGQAALPDIGSNIQTIGSAVMHPIKSLQGIGDLASGALAQIGHKVTGAAYNPQDVAKVNAARALEQHFGDLGSGVLGTATGDHLGDSAKLKRALATAPASTMMDASMFTPIPGAALKGAATAAKFAGAAGTAEKLAAAGNIAAKAARYTDPVNLALKTASAGADLAGAAPRAFLSARSGMTTDLQKAASQAGKNIFSPQGKEYWKNATGAKSADDVGQMIKQPFSDIQREQHATHRATVAGMSGNPSYWPIKGAIQNARKALSPGGIDNGLNDAAHVALNDAEKAVDTHIQAHNDYTADPAANADLAPLSGVQGLDKLKQDLWNTVHTTHDPAAKSALKEVWAAARGELSKVPGYSDQMETAQAQMAHAADMAKTLGVGSRTSNAAALAKTLKGMKSPTGASMVKELNKRDPRIMATLAGQAAHAGPQGGTTNAILSMVNPALGIPAVASSTPALVGAANYAAGAAGSGLSAATRAGRYAGSVLDAAGQNPEPDQEPAPKAAPPAVKATPQDAVLAAKVAVAEAANQPPEGQAAVVHTMLNRAAESNQSLGDVVTARHQYTGLSAAQQLDDDDPRVQHMLQAIVIPALSGDLPDPTNGSHFYYNPELQAENHQKDPAHNPLHPSFAKGEGKRIGDHVFYKEGGRVERASGGKVANPKQHEYLVNRLLRAAKDAKKVTDTTTEPLLKAPDEHIVKALNVAQRAI